MNCAAVICFPSTIIGGFTLLLLIALTLQVDADFICPRLGTTILDCNHVQLSDSKTSNILDAFITFPDASPLSRIDVARYGYRLTRAGSN